MSEARALTGQGRHGLTPNAQGALWMTAYAISFTVMTTLIKYLGKDYPAPLQTFYRQTAGFLILLPVILRHRSAAFATTRPWVLFGRSALGVTASIMSFYAYQKMPLAEANAISFTRGLWLVPLAIFVVREQVGPLRLWAAALGFVGVLMIVRPVSGGALALGVPALAMLASSLLTAVNIAGMKIMTRDHGSMVLLVWGAALGFLFSLPGAFMAWRWPEPRDLALLCLMGMIGTLNQVCYLRGLRVGDAAAMAPMDYLRLVFSIGAGFFLFHEVPGVWTLAGSALVIGSTLFITLREHRQARAAAMAAGR